MPKRVTLATLLVRDDEEALAFFGGVLGFTLAEDKPLDGAGKRWVTVTLPSGGAGLLLARADDDEQPPSAVRPPGGSPSSWKRMISRATTPPSRPRASASGKRRGGKITAPWRCSRTCMATSGT